ncbi:probable protein S-acyltransferase 15 [Phalaenopsis equestris]|uniref:probable protein S-acyltransferase 15 n=1 Tax=Phalaenopsis equestris TaxID=78828 RepID=UPI0009E2CDE2|nr:probable protein S-acyltransferase 15 [Phalaenopsis equestris]
MGGKKGKFMSLPVLTVIFMMFYVYCATVFVLLQDWLSLNSSLGLTNAIIFSFLTFMCLIAFLASVFIDPGGVPSSFAPEMENPQTDKGKSQYCDKCCAYKPPRAHHCRVCRRCVLKMDHHCSWIGNCVGYANYKSFIGCIFYGSAASIYSTVIFFCDTLHKKHGFRSMVWKLFNVLSGLALVLLSITISSLFAWHIYLLSKNLTTIEYREAARAVWLAKKCGQNYRHPFDLGVYSNLKSNLGSNLLKWFCPLAVGHVNAGTHFPISND